MIYRVTSTAASSDWAAYCTTTAPTAPDTASFSRERERERERPTNNKGHPPEWFRVRYYISIDWCCSATTSLYTRLYTQPCILVRKRSSVARRVCFRHCCCCLRDHDSFQSVDDVAVDSKLFRFVSFRLVSHCIALHRFVAVFWFCSVLFCAVQLPRIAAGFLGSI